MHSNFCLVKSWLAHGIFGASSFKGSSFYNSLHMSKSCIHCTVYSAMFLSSALGHLCVNKPVLSHVCQWILAPASHCFRMVLSVPLSEQDLVQLQHPSGFSSLSSLVYSLRCVIFISVLPRSTFVLHAPLIMSRSHLVFPFYYFFLSGTLLPYLLHICIILQYICFCYCYFVICIK